MWGKGSDTSLSWVVSVMAPQFEKCIQHKEDAEMGTDWMLRSIQSAHFSPASSSASLVSVAMVPYTMLSPGPATSFSFLLTIPLWEESISYAQYGSHPPANLSLAPCRMKKEDDSLTIFGVAERDQGSYTCMASTELDQDLAKAYLTVLGNSCHSQEH